jgi:putative hydrolase of the HAD superfamily
MAITHLIFDLSEVLIRGLVGIDAAFGELLGIKSDTLLHTFGGDDLEALCKNEIAEDDYLNKIITKEKWHCSPKELKKIIRNNFHLIIGNMDEIIEELSGKYTLILLSDHAREWIEYIEEYHRFLKNFSFRLYSFETCHLKNEMHNFQTLLTDLNISSESCLFIDDNKENIAVANQCGILGIVFKDQDQLINELREFGVVI